MAKPRRVFDVEDDTYSESDRKAERAIQTRTVQGQRYAKALEQLKTWRTRLKRASRKVKVLERRTAYYKKILAEAKP